jgi:hypothetical protein
MSELWACPEQGVCPALQELNLRLCPCRGEMVARCLREGLPGCPDLRRLKLFLRDNSTVAALATALEDEKYPKLETLSVTASGPFVGGEVVATALQASPRPGLRELELDVFSLGAGLVEALQSGACPGLTRMRLRANRLFGGGLNAEGMNVGELVEAFGACPHLQELALEGRMGERADIICRALAEAVREESLPCLEQVYLMIGQVGDDSATALEEALEAKGGHLLVYSDKSEMYRDVLVRHNMTESA